jgi:hypothetical protein
MHWKSVLTCILLAYLIMASAVSITVQYLASAEPPSVGHEQSSHAGFFR